MNSGSEAVTDQMFFHLDHLESSAKRAEWTHDEMELEAVFCDKVPGHRHSGRRLTDLSVTLPRRPVDDFVWTWYSECLVTQRTLDLLRDHGFTGFDVKPVKARFSRPCAHELPVLWELVVTGWGGVAPPESGVKLIKSCDVCKYKEYSACQSLDELFDPSQWDGSDFFFVWPLPKFIWVTERVAQCIRKHRLKGMLLQRPEEVSFGHLIDKFGPGRLSYYMPEARAKALGEALGIDQPRHQALTVHVITDGSGAVTERYAYGAFGEPLVYDGTGQALTGSAVDNPYLFAVRQRDGETRFYHVRHRDVPRRGNVSLVAQGQRSATLGHTFPNPTAIPERET